MVVGKAVRQYPLAEADNLRLLILALNGQSVGEQSPLTRVRAAMAGQKGNLLPVALRKRQSQIVRKMAVAVSAKY